MIKKIWNDPVASKVIAAAIIAIATVIYTWISPQALAFMKRDVMIPVWLLLLLGLCVSLLVSVGTEFVRRLPNRDISTPTKISLVDVNPSLGPAGTTYPLKCYVQLRIDSSECADVRIIDYIPQKVFLKQFTANVLQWKIGNKWEPDDHGTDHIAVLPNQLFRFWIGIDDKKFSVDEVKGAVGQIGTIVLQVNGGDQKIAF